MLSKFKVKDKTIVSNRRKAEATFSAIQASGVGEKEHRNMWLHAQKQQVKISVHTKRENKRLLLKNIYVFVYDWLKNENALIRFL